MGTGSTPSYQPPVDNSAQIELQRQQAEDARRAQEAAEKRTAFENNKKSSYTAAENQGRSVLSSKGLNTDEFMPIILNELNRIQSTIPDLDASPGSYYGPTLADDVLNKEQGNRRTKYGQEIDSTYAPGYANTALADTADDPFLEAIRSSAYGDALSTLQRGQARGTLSDTGFNSAKSALDAKTSGVNARLQQLGGGVLATNRDKLSGIVDEAKTGASNYTLGGTYSLDPYKSRYDSTLGEINKNLEGEVRGATEGIDFYGVNDILGSAARNQGASGGSAALADVLANRKKSEGTGRGLGSTGAF